MSALLNVGLHVNGRPALSSLQVLRALRWIGVEPLRGAIHESDTEPTFVVEVDRPLHQAALDALANALQQEAVAQWSDGHGRLAGPKAALWGPFDPAFFLTLDGKRLENRALAAA